MTKSYIVKIGSSLLFDRRFGFFKKGKNFTFLKCQILGHYSIFAPREQNQSLICNQFL